MGLLLYSAMSCELYLSAGLIKNKEMEVGDLFAYMLYLLQILMYFTQMSTNLGDVAKVQGAMYEIAKLIVTPSNLPEAGSVIQKSTDS